MAVTVAAGRGGKLVLAPATLTPVAAASNNITLHAPRDAYGGTAGGYAGAKHRLLGRRRAPRAAATVIDGAGAVINFGTATPLTFTSGVHRRPNGLKLYQAGAASVSAPTARSRPRRPRLTVSVGTAARWA